MPSRLPQLVPDITHVITKRLGPVDQAFSIAIRRPSLEFCLAFFHTPLHESKPPQYACFGRLR